MCLNNNNKYKIKINKITYQKYQRNLKWIYLISKRINKITVDFNNYNKFHP